MREGKGKSNKWCPILSPHYFFAYLANVLHWYADNPVSNTFPSPAINASNLFFSCLFESSCISLSISLAFCSKPSFSSFSCSWKGGRKRQEWSAPDSDGATNMNTAKLGSKQLYCLLQCTVVSTRRLFFSAHSPRRWALWKQSFFYFRAAELCAQPDARVTKWLTAWPRSWKDSAEHLALL